MTTPELPGTEHTAHVHELMNAAHADVEARISHGREAVQHGQAGGSDYPSYPSPMAEQPPPSGSGVDTDPFADETPGEEAREAMGLETAEEQSKE